MNAPIRSRPGLILAAAALGLLSPSTARAQDEPRPLTIGPSRLMNIRTGDRLLGRDWTIGDRIDHTHDVFAKYLGGTVGKITSRKIGDRVHLYLNGEFALAVTPADASATGYKTAEQLAPVWTKLLQDGFDAARVATRSAAPM